MEREPFKPADGLKPRWQKLYDLVIGRKVGDEITYGEAAELLGLDHRDRDQLSTVQQTMREVQRRLENAGERTVGTVARFGWVVLDASRELNQVDRRLTKTRRAAGRVVRGTTALNIRRGELSQFERQRLDEVARSGLMAAQITGRRKLDLGQLRKITEGLAP